MGFMISQFILFVKAFEFATGNPVGAKNENILTLIF